MSKVQQVSPHIRDIHVPAPLRDLPLWLVWAYEQHPGDKKPRKMPQYSGGGRRAGVQGSAKDLGNLTVFSTARDAATRRGLDGVGFAPTTDAGVIALDFDNCVKDGKVDQTVLELVAGTYAEYSPSGNGVRAFFSGPSGLLGNRKSHGLPFGVEAFSSTGFVTVTGAMLDHIDLLGLEDTIAPLPERVIEHFTTRFGSAGPAHNADDFMAGYEPKLGLTIEQMETIVNALDPDCSREDWIRVGMGLHHECEGDDTGFEIWDEWSSGGSKYPSEELLREQWDSFTRRMGPGHKQLTMATAIYLAKQEGLQWPPQPSAEAVMAAAEAKVAGLPPAEGLRTPEGFDGKFRVESVTDVTSRAPAEWLIKGVLPKAELVTLFGASGAGKSFVALDLAAHVAMGVPWRGRKTCKGRVLYVAAEGGGGMRNRLRAYCAYHNIQPADLDIGMITAAPNLLESGDVTDVMAAIHAIGPVSVVIVDTFAQTTPGANENTSEDMGKALSNAKLIHAATGATVVLVHHAGKDASRGARGWSGIKAAVDAEIEVVRHEDKRGREIRLTKQKEGEDDTSWGFTLARVPIELDADGEEVTSCVAVAAELPAAEAPESKGVRRRGRLETHVLEMIETLGDVSSISLRDLVDMCADALPKPEGRDVRRQTVVRAVKTLSAEKNGPLALNGSHVLFYQ